MNWLPQLNDFLKNGFLKCIAATLLIGFGVAVYIDCGLGSDPLTIFLDGVNRTFGIPVSVVNQALAAILLVNALILNRKDTGLATLLNVLLIGIAIEISSEFTGFINLSENPLIIRILMVIIAQCTLALGYAWMQTMPYGMSYTDALIHGVSKLIHQKYVIIRTVFDGLFFLCGILLKGVFGVGSIFAVFTLGYMIQKAKDLISKKT